MEISIEQALQQGVTAHKEGRLQEAERLYRAIIQSQPLHPDANHNLGVLAASFNKTEAALPLFKIALEANPKIEQFWLSYIDALIKDKQFGNAEKLIDQAKKEGIAEDRLNSLEELLIQFAQKKKKDKKVSKQNLRDIGSPPKKLLNRLLGYYQNRQFNDAEKLAITIRQEFPRDNFSWKILSAVFKSTNRKAEALFAGKKAVEITTGDATAHSNLGNILKELGKLEEAEASYRQAIALKPDLAEAHSNLGNTLKELSRLEEAEASYNQAIVFRPDYAEALSNLGNTLKELGRLEEAEASYRQAIALKRDFAEAHGNLGVTLQELGRLEEAEASFRQAIALKLDFAEAHINLGITLEELGRFEEAEESFRKAIALKPDLAEAHIKLLKCLYRLDKQALFFDKLDYFINKNTANATISSLTYRSALKYGLKKPNLFCREPLQYVLHADMNALCDFEKIFVEKARLILSEDKISNRKQSLLTRGSQTSGNLFDIKNSLTEKIQNVIRLEIEKYRVNFKDSKDGLIKKWPIEYSLYGWLISMKSGGNLKPHIHNEGWLSGSIYINVPKKLKSDSGNLVVSLGEENDAIDKLINEKKIINVVTGSMVLFPASLTHYTIPFESEEERIVLAFDVREK
tara:strand:+ start:431 stop:2326 length:1896 start_codon:yes stop_codon:yes gene_type:complete